MKSTTLHQLSYRFISPVQQFCMIDSLEKLQPALEISRFSPLFAAPRKTLLLPAGSKQWPKLETGTGRLKTRGQVAADLNRRCDSEKRG